MFAFFRKNKNFMEIPLTVKGALFVSPMPFGPYDTGNALLKTYVNNRIDFAVVLVTDDELKRKAKRDLLAAYKKNSISVIRFPVMDYTSPDPYKLSKLVDELSGYLRAGARMSIHCNAGVGRTAVVASCVVQDVMRCSPEDSIDHIKAHMMVNMTSEQTRLVKRFKSLEKKLGVAENDAS